MVCKTQRTRANNHFSSQVLTRSFILFYFIFCLWLFTGLVYTKTIIYNMNRLLVENRQQVIYIALCTFTVQIGARDIYFTSS